jgi:hypothetical protein
MSTGYKSFRDRAAHDRAHELWDLPDWHPDAPTGGMRHMLRRALRRCLTEPGYCPLRPAPSIRSLASEPPADLD